MLLPPRPSRFLCPTFDRPLLDAHHQGLTLNVKLDTQLQDKNLSWQLAPPTPAMLSNVISTLRGQRLLMQQ